MYQKTSWTYIFLEFLGQKSADFDDFWFTASWENLTSGVCKVAQLIYTLVCSIIGDQAFQSLLPDCGTLCPCRTSRRRRHWLFLLTYFLTYLLHLKSPKRSFSNDIQWQFRVNSSFTITVLKQRLQTLTLSLPSVSLCSMRCSRCLKWTTPAWMQEKSISCHCCFIAFFWHSSLLPFSVQWQFTDYIYKLFWRLFLVGCSSGWWFNEARW